MISLILVFIRYWSFGKYTDPNDDFTKGRWPSGANAAFNGLAHYFFIISIVMILLPIFIGKISIVRSILSADVFRPLSRI